jgi:hypothetical protein
MGYHDSLNAIKKSVADGQVEIAIDGGDVVFSGDTFRHKDFLKKELRSTDFHWDRDRKCWKASVGSLYSLNRALIEEISGDDDIFCGM